MFGTKRWRCGTTALLLGALWAQAPAWAGVVLVGQMTNGTGASATKQQSTTYLSRHAVRLSVSGTGAQSGMVMLFRADQDLIWIIDEAGWSYRELGPKDIEAMGAPMPGGAPASP